MTTLAVIGNVSVDTTRYPDDRGGVGLGGAALLVSLAAARAGLRARPVCVLGNELAGLPGDADVADLDWTAATRAAGPATRFGLTYNTVGDLLDVTVDFGVAHTLTAHVLAHLARSTADLHHVCCRRPLDVGVVLAELAGREADFSVDFYLPSAEPLIRAALPWLPASSTVFVNAAEYEILRTLMNPVRLREVVVTDGARTARVLEFGQVVAKVRPPERSARDVTGAGDTLAGTYRALRARGATVQHALVHAVAAAAEHVTAPPLPIPAPRRA